ncbi:BRCT domain-containing protein [Dioscorea alata]|uniref:BRCT domain-containing protein n=2 Tax=Dioscorea alata TaxID=55571 RepID=A0ACB7U2V2_DIOAL|nr:BRCT domain-containing protein [Dioscorea alata]KAH7654598.1 BRCT domain-containing protein [Dioscorea alata]
MANCVYHSPQFSEDTAWLPLWLQPHQLPAFGDYPKGEHTVSPLAWKNYVCSRENNCEKHDDCLYYRDDVVSSGCRLFLSGEDNSTEENTSSENATSFHLHLSSVTGSQFSDHVDEIAQTGRHEPNKSTPGKPFSAIQTVQKNGICSNVVEVDGDVPESKISPLNCVQRQVKSSSSMPVSRAEQKRVRFRKKVDFSNLKNKGICDAVELSIAASEALVISEMATSSLQCETFPTEAILEIALRVKRARKESYLDLTETVPPVLLSDALDETDQLSDLDDDIMKNAFDDVGLSFNQMVAPTSVNSFPNGNSSHNSGKLILLPISSSPLKASNLESPDKQTGKSPSVVPETQDDISEAVSQGSDAFLIKNPDARTLNHIVSEEKGRISEVIKGNALRGLNTRTSVKAFFIRETSFISESMDDLDKHSSEARSDAGHEVVASSSTPMQSVAGHGKNYHEQLVPSRELVRSSSFSLVDPLCSVVPCSLPDVTSDVNQKSENKNLETITGVPSIPLSELNCQCTVPDSKVEGHDIFKINTEGSILPSHRQFNLLKHCSMVVPNQGKVGEMAPAKAMPRESIKEKPINLFLTGKSTNFCAFKDAPSVPSSPKGKFEVKDGSENHNFGNMYCEQVKGPTSFRTNGAESADVATSVSKHQVDTNQGTPPRLTLQAQPLVKRSLPTKKVHFLEAKEGSGELQSLVRASGSKITKKKRVNEQFRRYKYGIQKDNCRYITKCNATNAKALIFQSLEFLLTGFSAQTEKKLEAVIREFGGYVLSSIPSCLKNLRREQALELSTWKLPIVLSPKKSGFLLTPKKYVNRPIQASKWHHLQGREPISFSNGSIFDKFAIMVYGKARFCTKFSKIIKCGGGLVYKSLQQLIQNTKDGKKSIGAILVEDESNVSRHLKQCILEQNLQMMTANWIINCLFSGKLLPFKKNKYASFHRIKMPTFPQDQTVEMSQEI